MRPVVKPSALINHLALNKQSPHRLIRFVWSDLISSAMKMFNNCAIEVALTLLRANVLRQRLLGQRM